MPVAVAIDSVVQPTRPLAGQRIGLLAGWGRYPIVIAEKLRERGAHVYGLGVQDHADPKLAELCDDFAWVGVAKIGQTIRHFRRRGVREVTMAGKIHKHRLFDRWAWLKHLPDWRALRLFAPHFLFAKKDRKDDTLLLTIVNAFAADGIRLAPATDYVPELLVKFSQLTSRPPSFAERKDIDCGWTMAKEIGRLDIGQSVAVKGMAPLAIEAIEGTDQCILRAGQLCRAGGFTVVKVAKPQQDMRFDVPTVGVGTLETMVRAGASCLAVEAGRTIFLDQDAVVAFANQHRLAIVALDAAGSFPPETNAAA